MDSISESETFLLLLLSDSNLPTGAFVASQGLESAVTHGLVRANSVASLVAFISHTLESYAQSALPFLTDSYLLAAGEESEEEILESLIALDALYESMTINHVAKRASTTQGVALLTLYAKGFAPRSSIPSSKSALISRLKVNIRSGKTQGNLPICFGVLCNSLALPLPRSQYLFLFLAARGLLSSSVRLLLIGPYAAQQILLYDIRPIIQSLTKRCANVSAQGAEQENGDGAVMTWPLGEILSARHDLQHSRIFNS